MGLCSKQRLLAVISLLLLRNSQQHNQQFTNPMVGLQKQTALLCWQRTHQNGLPSSAPLVHFLLHFARSWLIVSETSSFSIDMALCCVVFARSQASLMEKLQIIAPHRQISHDKRLDTGAGLRTAPMLRGRSWVMGSNYLSFFP